MYWPADPRRLWASPVQTVMNTAANMVRTHGTALRTIQDSPVLPASAFAKEKIQPEVKVTHLPNNTQLYRDAVLFEAIFERMQSHQGFVCTRTVTHMLRLVSAYHNFLLLWIYYWFLLRHRMNKVTILPLTLLTVLAMLYAPGTFCTKRSSFNKYDTRWKQAEPLQRHLHTDKKLCKKLLNIVTTHTELQSTFF